MELKATEQEVSLLHSLYSSIYLACSDQIPDINLPKPPEMEVHAAEAATAETPPLPTTSQSIKNHWDDWIRRMEQLDPVIEKFRQRLTYIDPVTEKPRYGQQTATRVTTVVAQYTTLAAHSLLQDPTTRDRITTQIQTAVDVAQQQAAADAEAQRQHDVAAAQAKAEAAAAVQRAHDEARAAEDERQQRAARALAQQIAEERRVAVEEAAADRAWVDSVLPRNVDSVRNQLGRFLTTEGSMASLEMIYAQILAHPEEEKFRRIRRNHPQFMEDIGQYDGGKEILIASGFDLGMVDEIPSFVCREPNVETDLDGWTTWFDLLKGTLDLIREANS